MKRPTAQEVCELLNWCEVGDRRWKLAPDHVVFAENHSESSYCELFFYDKAWYLITGYEDDNFMSRYTEHTFKKWEDAARYANKFLHLKVEQIQKEFA